MPVVHQDGRPCGAFLVPVQGREVCHRDLFGSVDMLHVCRALFVFVHWDRFFNPWHDPACPVGGISFWTTFQSGGDVGDNISTTEGTITALDGSNIRHKEVRTLLRMKIAVVVGPLTTAT